MAANRHQPPISVSSGNLPDIKAQMGGPGVSYMPHSKNTYRHVPGHHQAPIQPQYNPVITGAIPFPGHMNGQFYAAMNAQHQSYGHMYGGGPQDPPYYYYPHPGGWPIHAPMAVYPPPPPPPPPPQGYTHSPPNTPPQSGASYGTSYGASYGASYGYQVVPGAECYGGGAMLPPTPPHINFKGNVQVMASNVVPDLDQRRNSWSSSGVSEGPATPFVPSAHVDSSPVIVGGDPHTKYTGVSNGDGGQIYSRKRVESLLLAGPPLPHPIPAVFSPDSTKTMGESLENPTFTTNVYIRGLPPDTNDDKLYEMACRFGGIISHKAIMDTEHGTCKGYGFARYETAEQAEDCIRGLVSLKYEAGFARESFNARLKTLADPNSTNVYVSNLPRRMNEKDMQDIFVGFVVVSNRILRDTNGNSRGVGFARFEDRSICDSVIKYFHGKPVGEDQLPLQVRYADTSAQKRLKATTTKKRQFRSNEYNSVVNGSYMPSPGHHVQLPPAQYRNRVWLRHNSTTSNYDAGVSLSLQDSPVTHPNDWENPLEYHPNGDDESPREPYRTSRATGEAQTKLETVHENGDDVSSDCGSEVTTVPTVLESVGKASCGSFSDPGDSYGGLEMSSGDIF